MTENEQILHDTISVLKAKLKAQQEMIDNQSQRIDLLALGTLELIKDLKEGQKIEMQKWEQVALEFETIDTIINHREVINRGH